MKKDWIKISVIVSVSLLIGGLMTVAIQNSLAYSAAHPRITTAEGSDGGGTANGANAAVTNDGANAAVTTDGANATVTADGAGSNGTAGGDSSIQAMNGASMNGASINGTPGDANTNAMGTDAQSQYPMSAALSMLNGGAPIDVSNGKTISMPPGVPTQSLATGATNFQGQPTTIPAGTHYSVTESGYVVCTGSRAVDSPSAPPLMCPPPMQQTVLNNSDGTQSQSIITFGQTEQAPSATYFATNGVTVRPCVDPPSVRGLAYSRQAR